MTAAVASLEDHNYYVQLSMPSALDTTVTPSSSKIQNPITHYSTQYKMPLPTLPVRLDSRLVTSSHCMKLNRLCLSNNYLSPIFLDLGRIERYSLVLALTTGLKIELNDGLPQQICKACTDSVNSALNLRNQSHWSEIKLLHLGYGRTETENGHINVNEDVKLSQESNENSTEDCYDLDGFKIEIELDKITGDNQNGGGENAVIDVENCEPEKKKVKNAWAEKRKMYMELVDGVFDPNGPVKCRVCKKTVSKWACFINHAKKHLGFKFVCEFCGKSFISSTQLKRHCRSHHGMEKELKCKHCSYLALDNAQLIVHVRRQHTGNRPYVCDVCAAAYFSRKCLVQHIESHCPTASVQCPECPQLLKSRRHLAKHRYSAHGGSRARHRRIHDRN